MRWAGLAVLLLACCIGLAACSNLHAEGNAGATALPPLQVTPSAVADQLSPASSLSEAASQFAAVLQVAPDAVRVRIRPRSCIVCSESENRAATGQVGLAVDEATAKVAPNDDLWLFVQQLTCSYHFDGQTFMPRSCQFAPL